MGRGANPTGREWKGRWIPECVGREEKRLKRDPK